MKVTFYDYNFENAASIRKERIFGLALSADLGKCRKRVIGPALCMMLRTGIVPNEPDLLHQVDQHLYLWIIINPTVSLADIDPIRFLTNECLWKRSIEYHRYSRRLSPLAVREGSQTRRGRGYQANSQTPQHH